MSYDAYIDSSPRGQRWAYALEVQGLPELYTDGVASWEGVGRLSAYPSHVEGALSNRDFTLDFLCDPQDPLQVGGSQTFNLVDDGTDRVFNTFSKNYKGFKGYGRLAENVGAEASDTTIKIIPLGGTAALNTGTYLFVGRETMRVTGSPLTNTYTVVRGLFDTMRDEHRVFEEVRPQVNSSPSTFGDRIVTLWAAPVEDLSGTLMSEEAVPLWAGMIASVRLVDERVALECEPLTYQLQKDWPQVLPSAQFRRDATLFRLSEEDHRIMPTLRADVIEYVGGSIQTRGFATRGGVWVPLGYYDDAGLFVELVPQERVVRFDTFLSWVQDTTLEAGLFSPYDGDFTGLFSLRAVFPDEASEPITVRGTFHMPPMVPTGTFLAASSQLSIFVGTRGAFVIPIGSVDRVISTTLLNMQFLRKEQTTIPLLLDRPAHPFELTWHPDGLDNPVGVAVISTGGDHETILYRGVTIDPDNVRLVTLTGVTRGYGNTEARFWGGEEQEDGTVRGTEGAINVTQLLAITEKPQEHLQLLEKVPVGHVPLYILTSTPSRTQNGAFDRLGGYRLGMRIPTRWVDVQSFTEMGDRYMVPQISAFWVLEQGKGKEPLSELLKLSGLHFVTRRFIDSGGLAQFGLSLEAMDQPLATATTKPLTDDTILSGSRMASTHNERLVVNSTKIKPNTSWGEKEGKGDEVFHWDEWSIGEYGRGKQLEFKPSALLNRFDSTSGGNLYADREALVAWMYEVSSRWFAAFGRGSYTLEVDCVAPTVYKYMAGDLVAVSLSTARDDKGNKGLVAPARVIKVSHHYGTRAGGKVMFRLALDEFAELAPAMVGVVQSSNSALTLESAFTSSTTRDPFTGLRGTRDLVWFDPKRHGGPIRCVAWKRGDAAATHAELLITEVDLDTGEVTVDSSGTEAAFTDIAAVAGKVIITLAPYHRTTTALARLYAFLGSVEDELPAPDGGVEPNKVYA